MRCGTLIVTSLPDSQSKDHISIICLLFNGFINFSKELWLVWAFRRQKFDLLLKMNSLHTNGADICRFIPVNVSLVLVKKLRRQYRIPALSTLCDLLKILVPRVQKQVEALAKQNRYQCWSASNMMNTHCHTWYCMCPMLDIRRCMHHMLEMKINIQTFTATHLKWTGPKEYKCWLQDTRLFHFCLCFAVRFFPPFHSRSNCISMVQ